MFITKICGTRCYILVVIAVMDECMYRNIVKVCRSTLVRNNRHRIAPPRCACMAESTISRRDVMQKHESMTRMHVSKSRSSIHRINESGSQGMKSMRKTQQCSATCQNIGILQIGGVIPTVAVDRTGSGLMRSLNRVCRWILGMWNREVQTDL